MFKKLAWWLLRKELSEIKQYEKNTANFFYDLGLEKGYGLGKIAGSAEAKNMGYIVGGIAKDVEEILKSKGWF